MGLIETLDVFKYGMRTWQRGFITGLIETLDVFKFVYTFLWSKTLED